MGAYFPRLLKQEDYLNLIKDELSILNLQLSSWDENDRGLPKESIVEAKHLLEKEEQIQHLIQKETVVYQQLEKEYEKYLEQEQHWKEASKEIQLKLEEIRQIIKVPIA